MFNSQRLEEGMAHNLGLVIAKAIQGQLAAGVSPLEIVRQAALFGARNRDGWGRVQPLLASARAHRSRWAASSSAAGDNYRRLALLSSEWSTTVTNSSTASYFCPCRKPEAKQRFPSRAQINPLAALPRAI